MLTVKVIIISILINNKFTDPNEVADKFNEYFIIIAEKLQSKICLAGTDFMQYLNNSNEHHLFIIPIFPEEIIETINDLKSTKATGL